MISVQEASVVVPAHRRGEADRVLLDRISLELTEHRIAVIGANGSGKSTLLRLFNGLRAPTSGRVSVAGKDTVKDAAAVRARVGFVFTDPLAQLLMSTPVEDVALSLRAKVKDRAERARRAQELLDLRGVGHTAHQSIYDLSGGERQLVALTSVLAVEPRIVVADEPTTLLDLRNTRMLRKAFAALDTQVVIVTHDLDLADDADRVIVLEDGRVIADDVPPVALATYRRLMA